jgi:hypothetical protein
MHQILRHFETFVTDPVSCIMRTQHSMTFMPFNLKKKISSSNFRRDLQVILRLYRDPAEVLLGFDIDSCCVGYNGKSVLCLPRFKRAITMGLNLVDESRRSTSYERRLLKYSQRGFAVAIPGLSRPAMGLASPFLRPLLHPPCTTTIHSSGCLCNVLRYDIKRIRASRSEHDGKPKNNGWYEKRFMRPSQMGVVEQGDYDLKLSANAGMQGVATGSWKFRDGSTFFVGSLATALGDIPNMSPLRFITDQPGRQLLSGSFHPVSDDNWDHGVLSRPLLAAWRYKQPTGNLNPASIECLSHYEFSPFCYVDVFHW